MGIGVTVFELLVHSQVGDVPPLAAHNLVMGLAAQPERSQLITKTFLQAETNAERRQEADVWR